MRTGNGFRARRCAVLGALAPVVAVLALAVAPSSGASPPTVLVGGVPTLWAGTRDGGPLPSSRRLSLTVILRPRDAAALQSFALAVSNPHSPLYRRYLGIRGLAARFGAAPSSLARVRSTLRRDGLDVGAVAANGLSLAVSGSVQRISRAFGVRLRGYREASGRQVYANVSAPRLPAALGGAVEDVLGLDDLDVVAPAGLAAAGHQAPPHAPQARAAAAAGAPAPCAAATSNAGGDHAYTVDEIDHAYGIDGLFAQGDTGAGVTVALIEGEGYPTLNSDVGTFDQCYYGSTDASISTVTVDSGPPPGVEGTGSGEGEGEETSVDIQNTLGVAPSASIVVYQGPRSEQGEYDMMSAAINSGAQVIQDSWAECESTRDASASWTTAESALLEAAASAGESFLTSSGDRGSENCQNIGQDDEQWGFSTLATQLAVMDPAAQPFATGVGGTELTAVGPAPTETVWNQPYWGAGGGGISNVWAMPAYQATYGAPGVINSYTSGAPCGLSGPGQYCREVPDVSASASTRDGYVIDYDDAWTAVGGTSTSTPIWAGLIADADADTAAGCSASAPLGFLNPALYEIAAGAYAADAFNDVTSGDNNPQDTGPYPATPGYDMATGLGSPIATDGTHPGLVAQLCEAGSVGTSGPPTITAMSSHEASAGATVTLTGTGFTPFSRVLFGTVGATSVDFVSSTQLQVVVPPGSGVVTVTVTTIAGTAGSSPSPANTFTYAPTATISVPSPGAGYTQGQLVTAAYSCASSTSAPPNCSGSVPNGSPLDTSTLGGHQFTVTATDADATTTATAGYTVVPPPAVAISGPAQNATYAQGQLLTAQFSCATSAPVTIADCAGPVSDGAALDTQTLGAHSFTVVATDSNGVTSSETVTYDVASPPRSTVSTPANGAVFVRGSSVTASYLCSAAAPVTIVSCTANTVAGGRIDTSTTGVHRFSVTATASDGASTTSSVSYTVVAVVPQISRLREASSQWATRGTKRTRVPVGTSFSFTLDQTAKVTLRFARRGVGRLKARRCVAAAKAPRSTRSCRLAIASGALSDDAQQGANTIYFNGHTSAGSLSAGSYTVTLTAVGLSGKPSAPVTLRFSVAAAG